MIKNKILWEKLEKQLVSKTKPNYRTNLKIYKSLYKEAVALRIFPLKDPLEGIETDIKIAKYLNSVR
jgi:hypothetical protein